MEKTNGFLFSLGQDNPSSSNQDINAAKLLFSQGMNSDLRNAPMPRIDVTHSVTKETFQYNPRQQQQQSSPTKKRSKCRTSLSSSSSSSSQLSSSGGSHNNSLGSPDFESKDPKQLTPLQAGITLQQSETLGTATPPIIMSSSSGSTPSFSYLKPGFQFKKGDLVLKSVKRKPFSIGLLRANSCEDENDNGDVDELSAAGVICGDDDDDDDDDDDSLSRENVDDFGKDRIIYGSIDSFLENDLKNNILPPSAFLPPVFPGGKASQSLNASSALSLSRIESIDEIAATGVSNAPLQATSQDLQEANIEKGNMLSQYISIMDNLRNILLSADFTQTEDSQQEPEVQFQCDLARPYFPSVINAELADAQARINARIAAMHRESNDEAEKPVGTNSLDSLPNLIVPFPSSNSSFPANPDSGNDKAERQDLQKGKKKKEFNIWDVESKDEKTSLCQYWKTFTPAERKAITQVGKNDILSYLKEWTKHPGSNYHLDTCDMNDLLNVFIIDLGMPLKERTYLIPRNKVCDEFSGNLQATTLSSGESSIVVNESFLMKDEGACFINSLFAMAKRKPKSLIMPFPTLGRRVNGVGDESDGDGYAGTDTFSDDDDDDDIYDDFSASDSDDEYNEDEDDDDYDESVGFCADRSRRWCGRKIVAVEQKLYSALATLEAVTSSIIYERISKSFREALAAKRQEEIMNSGSKKKAKNVQSKKQQQKQKTQQQPQLSQSSQQPKTQQNVQDQPQKTQDQQVPPKQPQNQTQQKAQQAQSQKPGQSKKKEKTLTQEDEAKKVAMLLEKEKNKIKNAQKKSKKNQRKKKLQKILSTMSNSESLPTVIDTTEFVEKIDIIAPKHDDTVNNKGKKQATKKTQQQQVQDEKVEKENENVVDEIVQDSDNEYNDDEEVDNNVVNEENEYDNNDDDDDDNDDIENDEDVNSDKVIDNDDDDNDDKDDDNENNQSQIIINEHEITYDLDEILDIENSVSLFLKQQEEIEMQEQERLRHIQERNSKLLFSLCGCSFSGLYPSSFIETKERFIDNMHDCNMSSFSNAQQPQQAFPQVITNDFSSIGIDFTSLMSLATSPQYPSLPNKTTPDLNGFTNCTPSQPSPLLSSLSSSSQQQQQQQIIPSFFEYDILDSFTDTPIQSPDPAPSLAPPQLNQQIVFQNQIFFAQPPGIAGGFEISESNSSIYDMFNSSNENGAFN